MIQTNRVKLLVLSICFYALYWLTKLILLIPWTVRPRKSKIRSHSIIYLAAFFPSNAGYHWRVKKWQQILIEQGYSVEVKSAINKEELDQLNSVNSPFLYVKLLYRRFLHVLRALQFETVIVRRELLVFNDYGNLFMEKFLIGLHDRVILDFDDDISAAKREPKEVSTLFGKFMGEHPSKFSESLKLYKYFITGTDYLKDLVLKTNNSVPNKSILVLPTCVDYNNYSSKKYNDEDDKITLGWVGGNYNLFLLDLVTEHLNELVVHYDIELLVISGREYSNQKAKFKIINKAWSLETEIENLKMIDIGIMPLTDDIESRGKCGFKLIQYMGLGVVSVADAITVNNQIIDDKLNGRLIYNRAEWFTVIRSLLNNRSQLENIGREARRKVQEFYTFKSNTQSLTDFLSRLH